MEIILLVVVIVTIIELIIGSAWLKFYFISGIPIFKRSIRLSESPGLFEEALNDKFEKGMFIPLRFKKIAEGQVAFREILIGPFAHFKIGYLPVMHGLIRYNDMSGELHVIGFANWYNFLVLIVFIVFSSVLYVLLSMSIFFPIIAFALIYFIQAKRFNNVYKTLLAENNIQNSS